MATRFFSTAASLCCDNYLECAVWFRIWLVNSGYRRVGKENFSPINKPKSGHGSAVSLQLILGRWFYPRKGAGELSPVLRCFGVGKLHCRVFSCW